jgi:hypothetical protein
MQSTMYLTIVSLKLHELQIRAWIWTSKEKSGSGKVKKFRIRLDLDPQHCYKVTRRS